MIVLIFNLYLDEKCFSQNKHHVLASLNWIRNGFFFTNNLLVLKPRNKLPATTCN